MSGNRQTVAKANRQGDVHVAHTQTDSLILPTSDIERLQAIRPDMVDLVKDETKTEAAHRRSMETAFNSSVRIERLVLIGGSIVLGLGALGLAGAIAFLVNAYAGAALGSVSIVMLAISMLRALSARR
ncbi:MAG: hypothetical protein EAZ43_14530 [Betaproteobacteria bacterium]|nr:MAG: hypothetical protein EAZ43_14530 [Betaproteobacteria bacterium]